MAGNIGLARLSLDAAVIRFGIAAYLPDLPS